ncbi:hypothetical protein KI387_032848, partial [Taxus chinensis]
PSRETTIDNLLQGAPRQPLSIVLGLVKRETRFTSKHPAKEIISKIEEAAGPLGFKVKRQNYK